MGLYERYLLPKVIDLACGGKPIMRQRGKVVPHARGRVLEVGMGSGLNLPYYDHSKVEFVWGLEPSQGMRQQAESRLAASPLEVRWLGLKGEEIPLEDNSVDTVVLTYTLCTIPDYQLAMEQMRRVLKRSGQLLFCEHGKAPDAAVRRWQNRLNPIWNVIGGGCNLNRDIPGILRQSGFQISTVDTMYLPKTPRFAGFQYWGHANLA